LFLNYRNLYLKILSFTSFFQIRYLQTNYFLTQLIEVLSEESSGSRADDAALATDNSCTISTYDDSEDDNTAADLVYSCSCTSDLVKLILKGCVNVALIFATHFNYPLVNCQV
jgi:hypothetical protein